MSLVTNICKHDEIIEKTNNDVICRSINVTFNDVICRSCGIVVDSFYVLKYKEGTLILYRSGKLSIVGCGRENKKRWPLIQAIASILMK